MGQQAISPAVQPRVLWVVGHHLELATPADPACLFLLRTLAALLSQPDDAQRARR